MKTTLRNNKGILTVEDKYVNKNYDIEFNPESLIQWFPLNINYNYYYSYKKGIYYLGLDSNKVTKTLYGIDSKDLWNKGIGILDINNGDLFCPEVYLGNIELCNKFEELGITNFYHMNSSKKEINDDISKVLGEITRTSINISRRYEKSNQTNPNNLESYFETSLKIANAEECNHYSLLGSAYIMLLKMRDIAEV